MLVVGKETNWGYILEAEPMGLADVLDTVRENKRGIKDNSFFF